MGTPAVAVIVFVATSQLATIIYAVLEHRDKLKSSKNTQLRYASRQSLKRQKVAKKVSG